MMPGESQPHISTDGPVPGSKDDPESIAIRLSKLEVDEKVAAIEKCRAETLRLKRDLKRPQINWTVFGPIITTIVAGFIGLMAAAFVAYLNGKQQAEIEQLRATTSLIVEAVKTGGQDPIAAQRNLRFFLDAGLLKDPDGRIKKLVDKGQIPVLSIGIEPSDFGRISKIPPSEREAVRKPDSILGELHPAFRARVVALMDDLLKEGLPFVLVRGLVTPERQQTAFDRHYNGARAWESLYQYGFAASFALDEGNLPARTPQSALNARFAELVQIHGLKRIGYMAGSVTYPDVSIKDLKAGQYPPGDDSWKSALNSQIRDWRGSQAPPAAK